MKSTIARAEPRVFLLGLWDVLKIGFRWNEISRNKKAHFSLNHSSLHPVN